MNYIFFAKHIFVFHVSSLNDVTSFFHQICPDQTSTDGRIISWGRVDIIFIGHFFSSHIFFLSPSLLFLWNSFRSLSLSLSHSFVPSLLLTPSHSHLFFFLHNSLSFLLLSLFLNPPLSFSSLSLMF